MAESYISTKRKDKISVLLGFKREPERCHRCMSAEQLTATVVADATEEVQEQFLKPCHSQLRSLSNVSFKNSREGLPRGNISLIKDAQEHGKAKDALKNARKKGYNTVLERC